MNQNQKRIVIWVSVAAIISLVIIFCYAVFYHQTENGKTVNTKSVVAQTEAPKPTKDPHAGMVRSRLTGRWVKKSTAKKRPYAVMINNIEYAFKNQKGTSEADIIYEALAEGGIPRMMALYEDVQKVSQIGSIRSARHYYVQFANEWNAIFCHFGHTKYALSKIEKLKVDNLSGLSGIGSVVYARTNRLYAPHNVFTTGKKLIRGAGKMGYSLRQNEKKMAEHFSFYEKETVLKKGKKAGSIVLPFSYYATCRLVYQKKEKKYFKYEYGKKHMDRGSGKQLAFKNIIVQLVKESNIDRNGYQTMELSDASGNGYYISAGKQVPIRWKKKESTGQMAYYDKAGNLLKMNPGKTYIAVFPKLRKQMIRIQ